jgi:hypothetical protein
MKCIRCGADSKYKERANRTCPGCHKLFAFEPQLGDKLTDSAFQKSIDAVSAKGQVRWGVEHLYYEVARKFSRSAGVLLMILKTATIGLCVFAAATILIGKTFKFAAFLLPLAALCGFLAWKLKKAGTVRLALADFNRMWSTWRTVHGEPNGLIVRASARGTPTPRRSFDSDIADYSFDRAVICDRARTADLLIANNFHFENNCAVLSMDGYPEPLFDTVRSMLKRNPKLRVFALHDSSTPGCRIAYRLTHEKEWFAGQGEVTDVGLRPSQADVFRGLFLAAGVAVVGGGGISGLEARWLSQYTLELAVLRPEQVLKRLYAAMNRKEHEDFDDDSFRYEASDAEDAGDGFG